MAFKSTGTQKDFQKRITQQDIGEERISYNLAEGFSSSENLKLQFVSSRQKAADYVKMRNDLALAKAGRRLCGEECYPQCINNKEVLAWTKNKTSWPPKVLSRPQSYEKIVGIDCWKSLWRRSTALSNFSTQKRYLRRMGKILSVQLQKLVDSMPSRVFEVIKANGRSTKY